MDCLNDPSLDSAKHVEPLKSHKKQLKTPYVPTSVGELIDKITILEIKKEKLADTKNVEKELKALNGSLAELNIYIEKEIISRLKEVNNKLWKIEDDIRNCEKLKKFDKYFVELARSVYIKNDERASIKRLINLKYSSGLIEEKSYTKYN